MIIPLSFVIKCYNYAIYLPFLSMSIFIISNDAYASMKYLGYFNTLLTLFLSKIISLIRNNYSIQYNLFHLKMLLIVFIGFIINYFDFEYSLITKDNLSRRWSSLNTIKHILLGFVVILHPFLG